MAPRVVVFMAPGFEEMELTITVDVLRRAGVDAVIAGVVSEIGLVTGSRGIKMLPDVTVDKVDPQQFDMAVLPNGLTPQAAIDALQGAFVSAFIRADKE